MAVRAASAGAQDLDSLLSRLIGKLEAKGSFKVAEVRASVAAEVSSLPSSPPSSSDSLVHAVLAQGVGPTAEFVRNPASNVVPRVLLGPDVVTKDDYTALCGWRFGSSEFELSPVPFETPGLKYCGRRLPAEHQRAKVALSQAQLE